MVAVENAGHGRQMPMSMTINMFSRMKVVAVASAALAAVIGVVALTGWATNIPVMAQLYVTGSAMQPVTALSAILAAMVVLLLKLREDHDCMARLIAAAVLRIALQTLAEHWTGVDFGTDHLLFPVAVENQPGFYLNPGRMAEPTAAGFLLIAISLLLARVRGHVSGLAMSACATVVLLLVTVALLCHLYGVAPMTGILGFTQVSVPTALALGGLSVGSLALRPDGGWVGLLTGHSVGATAARRLLPMVITVPIIVASLALRGSQTGLYPADFRMAFTTAVTIILLAVLTLWGTRQFGVEKVQQSTLVTPQLRSYGQSRSPSRRGPFRPWSW